MVKTMRLSSKNAFAVNITIAPTSYLVNGASQESGATAKATVEAENASNTPYPTEGNFFNTNSDEPSGFQDLDASAKLVIDGGTGIICRGMTFTVAGDATVYIVTSVSNATVLKAFAAASVTTIYFRQAGDTGGNLASSPSNDAALTFDTTFRLPPYRMERDITIVNNDSSNAINVFICNPGRSLHLLTQPAARLAQYPVATLAASAAMTLELSDASDIYIKGAADSTITIFGS